MKPGSQDLSMLMRSANRGDEAAYRQVLKALAGPLRAIAARGLARLGRDRQDAEDIVQETLLAIHLKRHTWDESQPLEPWVRAIAHHKLVDGLRRRGFRQHVPIEDCDELLHAADRPVELSAAECADVLATLPDRQRLIVEGMAIQGRSSREVAEQLGMTEGAVRVTLHRALKGLAQAFRQDDP